MNSEMIGQTWDKLSGKHEELVSTFYSRFFEEYPDYQHFFPPSMDRQMKKMIETMTLVARVSQETEIAHPQLMKLGGKHTQYQLNKEDLERFKNVFLTVLGEYAGSDWTTECQQSWHEAFDQHVVPYMMRGLETA